MELITKATKGIEPINWTDNLKDSILVLSHTMLFPGGKHETIDQLFIIDFVGPKTVYVKSIRAAYEKSAKRFDFSIKSFPRRAFIGTLSESLYKQIFKKNKTQC